MESNRAETKTEIGGVGAGDLELLDLVKRHLYSRTPMASISI